MGLFITDQGKRSELQEKLAAELRSKIAAADDEGQKVAIADPPDGVDDSAYIKDFKKKFNPNGRVVALLVAGGVIVVVAGLVLVLTN